MRENRREGEKREGGRRWQKEREGWKLCGLSLSLQRPNLFLCLY